MSDLTFPYEQPKKDQQQIIQSILNLPAHHSLLIQADTGSGKTIASLSALMARKSGQQKIIIFVKTINQMNAFLREWEQFCQHISETKREDKFPLILPILGKHRICELEYPITKKTIINCKTNSFTSLPHWKKTKLKDKLYRKNRRFRLLQWINRRLIDDEYSATIEGFKRLLATRENCPYYNSRSIINQADIILLTYGYLSEYHMQDLLNQASITINNCLILLDEAHNLGMEQSYTIPRVYLEVFSRIFKRTEFMEYLLQEMRGLRFLDIEKEIGRDQLETSLLQMKGMIYKSQRILGTGILEKLDLPPGLFENNLLQQMLEEMLKIFNNFTEGRLIVSKDSMTVVDIEPYLKLQNIENAYLRIFQSATLAPVDAFVKLFHLERVEILDLIEKDIRIIRKKENEFRAFYGAGLSSISRFRNDELYDRYAKLIHRLFTIAPRHILVMVPSYEFGGNLCQTLRKLDLELTIIMETPHSTSDELIDGILEAKGKLLIIGNQRGKIMEGNEWVVDGASVINMVIFAGISLTPPRYENELIYRIREEMLHNKKMARLFEYQLPFYIRAKQALGRIIRGQDDRGVLIILDSRVDEFMQRNLWLYQYRNFIELTWDITQFYNTS